MLFEVDIQPIPSNLLSDRFLVPPFSILDTKQGYWQDRKRNWINLGIKSEEGRDVDCLPKGFDFENMVKNNQNLHLYLTQ